MGFKRLRNRSRAERFMEKVEFDTNGGCWLWRASLNGKYGQVAVRAGRPDVAHRVSWSLFRGPIPAGMNVCHHCDVTLCVNPDHLWLGTQLANVADMHAKRRGIYGERVWKAALSPHDVQIVRERLAAGDRVGAIARDMNVTHVCISLIKSGTNWRHLPIAT